MSLDFWRHIWESVCTLALGVPSGGWLGGLEKVNSTHPFHIQIQSYTHTHMTPLKEAPERHNEAFVRARFLMSPRSSTQIDHLSIALCLKGKCMHASETERGREKDSGRVRKKVTTQITSFLSLLILSPLVSCLPHLSPSFSHSLHTLPLSPQRNPVSPLGLELFEGDPELYCLLPLLSSLSALPPSPSTLRCHPSALRGPGSCSTKSSRAPNPGPGLALLPQALLAVPLHHRETERWEAWGNRTMGGWEKGESRRWEKQGTCVWSHSHLAFWRKRLGRRCNCNSPSFPNISLFSSSPSHNCLFSFSFHPYAPSLFPSHFPCSLHPKGKLFTHSSDWFLWHTSRTQTHTFGCQHTFRHIALHFNRGSVTQFLRTEKEKTENDKQTEKKKKKREADKEREWTGGMCIPLACLAWEHRRRVAGCSVYYPQAIWVGKLLGCGGIHVCLCVSRVRQQVWLYLQYVFYHLQYASVCSLGHNNLRNHIFRLELSLKHWEFPAHFSIHNNTPHMHTWVNLHKLIISVICGLNCNLMIITWWYGIMQCVLILLPLRFKYI